MTLTPANVDGIRLARVVNVDFTTNQCELRFFDTFGSSRTDIQLGHPYLGRGWGIYTGVETGSIALVGEEIGGKMQILAYLPQSHFFRDDYSSFPDVTPDESQYRKVRTGEIVMQSKTNSAISLNNLGDVILETADGNTIEIDKAADLIYQQSAQRETICDVGTSIAGVVRRDVRSLEERELDILFGGVTNFGYDFDIFTDTVGIDPKYPDVAKEGGKSQSMSATLIPGLFDPFFPEKLEEGRGSRANISDMLNPALTESKKVIKEFGDGNPGIDPPLLDDTAKRRGHIEPNTLAEITTGTLVNDVGRQLRFDYGFGRIVENGSVEYPKGHGRAWITTENQTGESFDGLFSRENTLKGLRAKKTEKTPTTAPGHNVGSEWTVDSIEQAPMAILYRTLLHTKGVDGFGRQETDLSLPYRSGQEEQINTALTSSYPGSLWDLLIDKEGLTKLNIPAATDVDGLEPYRAGRSLLANFDGDITLSVGKQKATGQQGIPRLTQNAGRPAFLNRNDYPEYGRKDRSLTMDLAGNLETHIGADDNVNQSVIAQLDGSMSMLLGKEGDTGIEERGGTPAGAGTSNNSAITPASKSRSRTDRSFTGMFAGNVELAVGHDEAAQQSLIISTTGGNAMFFDRDRDDQSLRVVTEGGIDIQIQGPMQTQNYALHIDAQGVVHIKASQDIKLETPQQCYVQASTGVRVLSDSSIDLQAPLINIGGPQTQNINIAGKVVSTQSTDGGSGTTWRGGSFDVVAGSSNINSPGGFNVLGSLGVAGQFLCQGAPGLPAFPIARVGDLVQVGPAIGQIIKGSDFARSI